MEEVENKSKIVKSWKSKNELEKQKVRSSNFAQKFINMDTTFLLIFSRDCLKNQYLKSAKTNLVFIQNFSLLKHKDAKKS